MKRYLAPVFTAVLLSAFSLAVVAQSNVENSVPSITVTGRAEILVEPDSATISVDFTKLNKDLQTARRENDEGVAKMLEVARKFAIPAADVSTNNISVKMKYVSVRDRQKPIYDEDGDEIGMREFQGYEVTRSVTIKLTKLDDFDVIFNDILKTGPSEIDSVTFESSRLIELREAAREMAMKAAHEKAKAMTAAIGQTVGKALRISEGTLVDRFSSSARLSSNGVVNVSAATSPQRVTQTSNLATFSAGTIKIEASVTVIFAIN